MSASPHGPARRIRTRARSACVALTLALLAAALTREASAAGTPRPTTFPDTRTGFDASFYFGLGIDSFAASDLNRYLNPEASSRKLERGIGGFDFAYRLAGNANTPSQLWIYGETVHGMRSADLDLSGLDSLASFRLTGIADPGARTLYMLRNATSLEAYGGLRWEFGQMHGADADAASSAYLFGQYGFLSIAGSGQDVINQSFYGFGVSAIRGRFEGSRLETGTGQSDFFHVRPKWRFKVNGELVWSNDFLDSRSACLFTQIVVDSDCGPGADNVQSYLGLSFDLKQFLAATK